MTPEGKVKAKLDRKLKALGVWFFSPQAGPHGVSGIPDRVLIHKGRFIGVECKRDSKHKLTDLQEAQRKKIENAGGLYFVVYDDDTMQELLNALTEI